MKLRVLESQWVPFVRALCARRDVETAGVILAERLEGGEVLFARHLTVAPESGYAIRTIDQLRIDAVAFNRLIRPARDGGLSVLTIHTHPGSSQPWFSLADDQGDSRLMPSLFAQTPGPHGSLVIAGDTGIAAARAWSEHGTSADVGVHIIGAIPQFVCADKSRIGELPWFDRQQRALGDDGQVVLRSLHVAVVGLGGTGSVAFVQLAHLGVGRITVIDGDRVEASNVSRILGATTADAGVLWKVDVASRYARQLNLGTTVTAIRGHLGADVPISSIEGCDIVLSCVDRHLPRALLNRLAYSKAIPTIDMGSAFRVDRTGRIVGGAGRVVIVGPGRRCLGCWGHIDPHRIRIEGLPASERAAQAAEGYVEGADVPQPSVVAFNTAVAGAAVTEFLRLATHYGGLDDPPMRLSFDFLSGTVRRNVLTAADSCTICLPHVNQSRETEPQSHSGFSMSHSDAVAARL